MNHRMGTHAIEGTTWDIFFGRILDTTVISLEDGFIVNELNNVVFIDSERFMFDGITEHDFRGQIKRFIVKNEMKHGNMDFVRFIPEGKSVIVAVFKGK